MKRSRYTEEQIAFALRQAESGMLVSDVCRQMGVSEATFYVWKKKYANSPTPFSTGHWATGRPESRSKEDACLRPS